WIDFESRRLKADFDIRAFEQAGQTFKAPTQVENEGVRIVFLQVGDEKVQQEGFTGPGAPENDAVGGVLAVQIQIVRCAVICLQHRQIFLFQMGIDLVPGMQSEKEGIVSIVRIKNEHRTQVERVVAGNGCKISVEQVVFFFVKLGILDTEGLVEVRRSVFRLGQFFVVDDYSE